MLLRRPETLSEQVVDEVGALLRIPQAGRAWQQVQRHEVPGQPVPDRSGGRSERPGFLNHQVPRPVRVLVAPEACCGAQRRNAVTSCRTRSGSSMNGMCPLRSRTAS